MTGGNWGHGGSVGPPWSVDLIADLQAEVLDPDVAAELRPRVNADPEARAILAALDATRSDLRALTELPATPMPEKYAARLDAAIESELAARAAVPDQRTQPSAPSNVIDLAAARRRRNRIVGWGAGVFAAAAAAVAIAAVTLPSNNTTSGVALPGDPPAGTSEADAAPAPSPLTFKAEELGTTQLEAAQGANDYGPFAETAKRTACFTANGINKDADPLGGRQVTVDGKRGTLFVLSSGLGKFRLIAVEPSCGPANPAVLADKTIGGVKPTG
jgi:hypothetical protein